MINTSVYTRSEVFFKKRNPQSFQEVNQKAMIEMRGPSGVGVCDYECKSSVQL